MVTNNYCGGAVPITCSVEYELSVLIKLLFEKYLEIFHDCDISYLGYLLWALCLHKKNYLLVWWSMTTSYFSTKWRLFINFLDCTHILSSRWYDSHIMFCMLSESYCCFQFSPNVLVLSRDIILFKEIKSRSQYIYKEPMWCNLAVCLLLTAIVLYMFWTLFASILRST
jgi:hypothetical protein